MIRFAILGAGLIAQRHAKHIAAHGQAQLLAAYDLERPRAEQLCSNFGGVACTDLPHLLGSDADVVSAVAGDASLIGYVDAGAVTGNVKVILVVP